MADEQITYRLQTKDDWLAELGALRSMVQACEDPDLGFSQSQGASREALESIGRELAGCASAIDGLLGRMEERVRAAVADARAGDESAANDFSGGPR